MKVFCKGIIYWTSKPLSWVSHLFESFKTEEDKVFSMMRIALHYWQAVIEESSPSLAWMIDEVLFQLMVTVTSKKVSYFFSSQNTSLYFSKRFVCSCYRFLRSLYWLPAILTTFISKKELLITSLHRHYWHLKVDRSSRKWKVSHFSSTTDQLNAQLCYESVTYCHNTSLLCGFYTNSKLSDVKTYHRSRSISKRKADRFTSTSAVHSKRNPLIKALAWTGMMKMSQVKNSDLLGMACPYWWQKSVCQ